jgi:osmotically-inducible protein OsmY
MKSDSQLQNDVLFELRSEPSLHIIDIKVQTHLGTVTLSGTVKHFADKFAAERATQRVAGVRAIAQHLIVSPSGVYVLSDTDIAETVVRALRLHVLVPEVVQAIVEDSWVTLSGNVSWAYQRDAAEDAIRYLPGIKGIYNSIELSPSLSASEICSEILDALHRNAQVDSSQISVTHNDHVVFLRGTVHSWAERREACTVAWKSPGVRSVQNELEVVS